MSPRRAQAKTSAQQSRSQGAPAKKERVRFGIAAKFTLSVTIVVTLVFLFMGMWIYDLVANRQEAQFNNQGVFAVRIAAAPEIGSWRDGYDTLANLYSRTAEIEAELAIANQSSPLAGSQDTPKARAIAAKQRRFDNSQRSFNRKRLKDLVSSKGALDVWVVDTEDRRVNSASGKDPAVRLGQKFKVSNSPETRVISGSYQTPSGEWEFARFFVHPVKNRKNEVAGHVWLAFSEKELRATRSALKGTILGFCLVGILLGGLVAFLISRGVTGPLASLMRDVEAVAAGDLSHRTRQKSKDEVGALAVAFDEMTRKLEQAESMRADLADKDHQINVAHEVQERLFPSEFPAAPGCEIDASCRLSGELSADLFDTIALEDGRVGLLVMTASGRGIPSAIVLSMARAIFRSVAPGYQSPADALRAINRILAPDLRRGMYVSAFYAVVDPASGQGTLACAGHRIPAAHYVAERGGMRTLLPDGMAIGLDSGPVFDSDLTEEPFQLAPGDRLVLATEGAHLLKTPDGEALGQKRFFRLVLRTAKTGEGAAALLESIEAALAEDAGEHDLSVAMITRIS